MIIFFGYYSTLYRQATLKYLFVPSASQLYITEFFGISCSIGMIYRYAKLMSHPINLANRIFSPIAAALIRYTICSAVINMLPIIRFVVLRHTGTPIADNVANNTVVNTNPLPQYNKISINIQFYLVVN